MAVAATRAFTRRPRSERAPIHSVRRPCGPTGSTLEDVVLRVWEDLASGGPAECPVCRGALEPSGCTGCGSLLS